jgi:hypothetical protein
MKQKSLYILLLLLFYTSVSLQAQTYASLRLQMLGEMMPVRSIPVKDSIFRCTKVLQGKMLTVNYNEKQEIEHLGVSLFSAEIKDLINKPVCNFIERILLDLLLHEKEGMLQRKLDEFEITLANTGIRGKPVGELSKLLNAMQEPVQFQLNQDNKRYQALWLFDNDGNSGLEMTFPANRELIFGTNKVESDTRLNEMLAVQHCTDSFAARYSFPEIFLDSVHAETGFYVRRGKFLYAETAEQRPLMHKGRGQLLLSRFRHLLFGNILKKPFADSADAQRSQTPYQTQDVWPFHA